MPIDLDAVKGRVRVIRVAFSHPDETQKAFAERHGFSETAWHNYENYQRIGLDAAVRVSEALGVTLDWIYLGEANTLRYNVREALGRAQEALDGVPVSDTKTRVGRRDAGTSSSKKPSNISRAKSRTRRA